MQIAQILQMEYGRDDFDSYTEKQNLRVRYVMAGIESHYKC